MKTNENITILKNILCLACKSTKMVKLDINHENYVTSDCNTVNFNPSFFICCECTLIQKEINSKYIKTTKNIYDEYKIYKNANGAEQSVFSKNGLAKSRYSKIIDFLMNNFKKKKKGKLLEIGFGNGSFLSTFSKLNPTWKLMGTEFDDRNKKNIEQIKNTSFHHGDITSINEKFDLIVCIHVLEHIYSPKDFLNNCEKLLNEYGKILIQVPDYKKSPFDIFIADHCSHFSIDSLSNLVVSSGLRILEIGNILIEREITLLIDSNNIDQRIQIIENNNSEFQNLVTKIENLFLIGDFTLGVFGSSIAATMIYNSQKNKIKFFVDEDINKVGNKHLDIPIISVKEIPKKSIIVLPMKKEEAILISNRLKNSNYKFLY